MNINSLLKYMYALERFGIKPGLEVIKKLLEALGNPEKGVKYIHIAGTNGKGSTAAMIESILRNAGCSTGLYTSPHLVRFNERIKVNNEDIEDEDIARLVDIIKEATEKNNLQPTFFEFTTALAFLYFKEKKPDYVILETGFGGRLDATNVIIPEVSIITNISFDHQEYLGNTIKKIAFEKAGIIKPGVKLVTAETKKEALEIFEKHAENIVRVMDYELIESNMEHQVFMYDEEYEIKMLGEFQIINACTAIEAMKVLRIKNIKEGIKKANWPGRLEIIKKDPLIIMDCAHNEEGIIALKEFLKKKFTSFELLIGISNDKDISMFTEIVKLADNIIITKAEYKGEDPKKIMKELGIEADIISTEEATHLIKRTNKPMLITGSIYMIGDIKSYQKQ